MKLNIQILKVVALAVPLAVAGIPHMMAEGNNDHSYRPPLADAQQLRPVPAGMSVEGTRVEGTRVEPGRPAEIDPFPTTACCLGNFPEESFDTRHRGSPPPNRLLNSIDSVTSLFVAFTTAMAGDSKGVSQ